MEQDMKGPGNDDGRQLGGHAVQIIVNTHKVSVDPEGLTGLKIKEAAIAQGVKIKLDFVLFEDLSNGQQIVVKDDQPVKVHEHERFEAIDNDDHS